MTGTFLDVITDPLWATPCLAYNVQVSLQDEVAAGVGLLQHALAAQLRTPMRLVPREALHISLYGVLPVRARIDDKDAVWMQLADDVLDQLDAWRSGIGTIAIMLERVRITPQAVILHAAGVPASITQLRARLAQVAASCGVTTPHYDLVHVTLARFAADARVSVPPLRDVELVVEIERVQVVREVIYPSLQVERIAELRLGRVPTGPDG